MPAFADASTASCASSPITFSICSRTRSGSAEGRSTLLMTGEDVEVVVDGQVAVGQRLRFDALRGVDDEHRPFARGEAARDFVGEVDVAGRVDQVEDVVLPVFGLVLQR